MPALTHSVWDTLPESSLLGWLWSSTREQARFAERCRRRTKHYDLAVIGAPSLLLAADLPQRLARWEQEIDPPRPSATANWNGGSGWGDFLDPLSFGIDDLFGVAIVIVAFLVVGLVAAIIVTSGFSGFHLSRARRVGACRRALAARACPDCGYDLRGHPDAIDPVHTGDAHCGPTRCPECGVPWPLVPPPGRFTRQIA